MSDSTVMRISKSTVDNIKLLKQSGKFKGSHQDIVTALVDSELKKSFVSTVGGYVGIGSVVLTRGETLVISDISEDIIKFRDGSTLLNGGVWSQEMKILADSVESYEGGLKGG